MVFSSLVKGENEYAFHDFIIMKEIARGALAYQKFHKSGDKAEEFKVKDFYASAFAYWLTKKQETTELDDVDKFLIKNLKIPNKEIPIKDALIAIVVNKNSEDTNKFILSVTRFPLPKETIANHSKFEALLDNFIKWINSDNGVQSK